MLAHLLTYVPFPSSFLPSFATYLLAGRRCTYTVVVLTYLLASYKHRGYSLSDHGLVRAQKVGANNVVRGLVNLVPAQTEQQIFAALGLDWKEPVDRNCEVETVGGGTLLAHTAV